jgi:hypothetical protein
MPKGNDFFLLNFSITARLRVACGAQMDSGGGLGGLCRSVELLKKDGKFSWLCCFARWTVVRRAFPAAHQAVQH